ncbi:endonuclease/exonuclease/phosphatase family protein [Bacteroidota bacterium]
MSPLSILIIAIAGFNTLAKYNVQYYVNGIESAYDDTFSTTKNHPDSTITVGTFNAAILKMKVAGKNFEPTPLTIERLHEIPNQLRKLDVDILGIQEVYEEENKLYLIDELKSEFPYCIYYQKRRKKSVGLPNGLMFLSKIPILASQFTLYHRNPLTEKIMADKGILTVELMVGSKRITITNTHTTVGGGLYHTESDKANSVRNKQIQQAIQITRSTKSLIEIILGDFNAGPNVSAINYQLLLDSGFVDTYNTICGDTCDEATWDPTNILNNSGHFPDSPPQRIDNIFVTSNGEFEVLSGDVILDEEVLENEGKMYPISDHYGYSTRIKLKQLHHNKR